VEDSERADRHVAIRVGRAGFDSAALVNLAQIDSDLASQNNFSLNQAFAYWRHARSACEKGLFPVNEPGKRGQLESAGRDSQARRPNASPTPRQDSGIGQVKSP